MKKCYLSSLIVVGVIVLSSCDNDKPSNNIEYGATKNTALDNELPSVPTVLTPSTVGSIPQLTISSSYTHNGERKKELEQAVLHTGDQYKLVVEPRKDGYLYIFQEDAHGKIDVLFPTKYFEGGDSKNDNPVSSRKSYFIPSEERSFILDDHTGQEIIYVSFSEKPHTDLRKLSEDIISSRSNADKKTKVAEVEQRYGPLTETQLDSIKTGDAENFIKSGQSARTALCPENGCFIKINFTHK